MIALRNATAHDAWLIANQLTHPSVEEIKAVSGMGVISAIEYAITHAAHAYTAHEGDDIVCIFGVNGLSVLGRMGMPWVLSTNRVNSYSKRFLRVSKRWMDDLKTRYDLLATAVVVEYTQGIKWMEWLGFEVTANIEFGSAKLVRMEWKK